MSPHAVELLLVEDNDDDVVMTQEAFARANVLNHINVVRNGQDALAYLRKQDPYQRAPTAQLVLLDINMPQKDGFEVLKEIKADPVLQHLPVIMLTTSAREEDVVKSYSNGACSYISKPVNFHQFHEVVKQFELYWTLVSRVPQPKA